MDLADPDDPSGDERRPTIADVPGLIEGASSGAGLGHAFLRHVERTRVLLHMVDGSARDAGWDHDVIREELLAHDPALLEKPILVVFNKLDQPAAVEGLACVPCRSRGGRRGHGRDLRNGRHRAGRAPIADRRPVPDAGELGVSPEPTGVVVHRIDPADDRFLVEEDPDGAFRVRGRRIERIAAQTNFEVEELAERFQKALARPGHRRRAPTARRPARRPRPDRHHRARVGGPALGGLTDDPTAPSPGRPVRAPIRPGSIGMVGGTFDPFHVGHLALARAARDQLGLERVLVVPAAEPPHKPWPPDQPAGGPDGPGGGRDRR